MFTFGALAIGIITMAISYAVSARLKNKFKKYSMTPLQSGMSGQEVAEKMLHDHGIYDVQIRAVEGQLSDHYNPADKTVNLSKEVYYGRNAAAAAVAAHECGHAVQHAKAYSMLQLRSALVPIQNVSAKVMNMIFMAMMFGAFMLPGVISWNTSLLVIIVCYGVFTLFAFVTLPVEFDASRRALAWIGDNSVFARDEHANAKDALWWAAMTYVVAALGSLATLLYYVMLFFGNDD